MLQSHGGLPLRNIELYVPHSCPKSHQPKLDPTKMQLGQRQPPQAVVTKINPKVFSILNLNIIKLWKDTRNRWDVLSLIKGGWFFVCCFWKFYVVVVYYLLVGLCFVLLQDSWSWFTKSVFNRIFRFCIVKSWSFIGWWLFLGFLW